MENRGIDPYDIWILSETEKALFLSISDQTYNESEKAIKEAELLSDKYENEIKNKKNKGYYDYEMEVAVLPYFSENKMFYHEEGYDGVREYNHNYVVWTKQLKGKEPHIYLDRSTTWNIEELSSFSENEYVCYFMHCLVCHLRWTLAEILAIEFIEVVTKTSFQRKWKKDVINTSSRTFQINK